MRVGNYLLLILALQLIKCARSEYSDEDFGLGIKLGLGIDQFYENVPILRKIYPAARASGGGEASLQLLMRNWNLFYSY